QVARVSSVPSESQGARADKSSSSTPSAPALATVAGHTTTATAVGGASGHGGNNLTGDDTGGRTSGGRKRSDNEGERDRGAAMLAALDGRDEGALARHSLAHDGASRTLRGDGVGGGEAVGGLARSDATERIAR